MRRYLMLAVLIGAASFFFDINGCVLEGEVDGAENLRAAAVVDAD